MSGEKNMASLDCSLQPSKDMVDDKKTLILVILAFFLLIPTLIKLLFTLNTGGENTDKNINSSEKAEQNRKKIKL